MRDKEKLEKIKELVKDYEREITETIERIKAAEHVKEIGLVASKYMADIRALLK